MEPRVGTSGRPVQNTVGSLGLRLDESTVLARDAPLKVFVSIQQISTSQDKLKNWQEYGSIGLFFHQLPDDPVNKETVLRTKKFLIVHVFHRDRDLVNPDPEAAYLQARADGDYTFNRRLKELLEYPWKEQRYFQQITGRIRIELFIERSEYCG